MTSQGTAAALFSGANLFRPGLALREVGTPSLPVALAYLELLADVRPD
jgi:hypothetical protein